VSKNIALLPRKPGLSRAQFRDYYERRHALLAISHFPMTRYIRNHLPDAGEPGFDAISEFWSDDLPGLGALMQTQIGELMRADEERFMDRDAIRSGSADEYLLAGPPRSAESASAHKHAWLLSRTAPTEAQFVAAITAWAAPGHPGIRGCERLLLDVVHPWPGTVFPFDAVLWCWRSSAPIPPLAPLPAGATLWRTLAVRAAETSPEAMAQALHKPGAGEAP
jgi:hypothetical protein